MNTNIISTMHTQKPKPSTLLLMMPLATVVLIGLLVLQVVPKALALRTATEFEAMQSTRTPSPFPKGEGAGGEGSGPSNATQKRPATITWYGPGYHGQKTASGKRYDRNKITFAVPPSRRGGTKPIVRYGTIITITYKGKSITGPALDLCPGMTWDCSDAGMRALGFKNLNQKLKGEVSW